MVLPHFLSPVAEEGLVRYSISLPRDGGVFNSGKILKHFNGNSFLEGVVDIVFRAVVPLLLKVMSPLLNLIF